MDERSGGSHAGEYLLLVLECTLGEHAPEKGDGGDSSREKKLDGLKTVVVGSYELRGVGGAGLPLVFRLLLVLVPLLLRADGLLEGQHQRWVEAASIISPSLACRLMMALCGACLHSLDVRA